MQQPDNNLGQLIQDLESDQVAGIRKTLTSLNPPEIARLLESLTVGKRKIIWQLVDQDDEGEILKELVDDVRQNLIEEMDTSELIAVTQDMELDDLADLLIDLPEAITEQIITALDQQDQVRLESVMSYEENTAGGLTNPRIVSVRRGITIEVLIRYLRKLRKLPEDTNYIYIVNKQNAETIDTFEEKISFNNVSFRYESDDTVLQDISFEIEKGSVVALVGSSGAGKSTLADLIPRFYDVNQGSITIDEQNIQNITLNSLRSMMGIVTQETILFNDSIRANIAYGQKIINDEQVLAASKAANALEFINELPEGIDTVIGEKGVKLSGGQRQRLAIARAIMKNPPILILDEATSALDTESERLVQQALETLMADRTVLVIAHRLSTVTNADKIIVLDKGEIKEMGTHNELMEKEEYYSNLYNIQFK